MGKFQREVKRGRLSELTYLPLVDLNALFADFYATTNTPPHTTSKQYCEGGNP
jgi:hypothetical protein